MAVFLAVVLPYFAVSETELKSEARKTAALLRYLNETASMKKITIPLVFDLDGGQLKWKEESERAEKLGRLHSVKLQSRGEVKEGELTVFFAPFGLREFLEVNFKDGEKAMTVIFNPISGRAKIK